MNTETIDALLALNRRFYDRYAAEFSATRRRPWDGWREVVECLAARTDGPISVLDLGCGNGRLASYLFEHWPAAVRYLGVDSCASLLEAARARLGRRRRDVTLRRLEITGEKLSAALAGEGFDLVALFGVLHHLPGAGSRLALLRHLAPHLTPRGILALSAWRLDRSSRFAAKAVSWERYNRRRQDPAREPGMGAIDVGELERGDYLVSWAGDVETPRYCHFPDDAEVATWLGRGGLRLVRRYLADGRGGRDNLYLLLEKPP